MGLVRQLNPLRPLALLLFAAALFAPLFSGSTPARAVSTIRINFQSEGALTPSGYLRDYGLGFGPRTNAEAGAGGQPGDALGLSFGWVVPGAGSPRSMVGEGRDRNLVPDQRLDTLLHMQRPAGQPGAWEITLSEGAYDVTVAVGEPTVYPDPELHTIRLEGQPAISQFVPSGAAGAASRSKTVTVRVNVSDGRLTVDAEGGTNTKIHYIDIVPVADPLQPYITAVTPADGSTGVLRNTSIVANVFVPGGGIRSSTVTNETVQLLRAGDLSQIPATVNTTAGGDVITLQPSDYLDPNTRYIFKVTSGVQDGSGRQFLPFSSSFTTGTGGGPGGGDPTIAFELRRSVASGVLFSSLAIGPDNKLYAATLEGYILRYRINSNGTLALERTISTVRDNERDPATGEPSNRAIIGLVFDPAATADNLVLWVSHNGPYVKEGANDWTGKIARLSGSNLTSFRNYVVNLPHSYKDHMANSLEFGPDGGLYISVGSNSAMGAPDPAWGSRPERLLSASVLRIATDTISSPPLDVKTEEGGQYNPFAANAPVTIYASGVRNAYDLVWHSNGELYLPTNGSAAGGNVPGTPSKLPAACQNRIDDAANGNYTGPTVRAQYSIVDQRDYLYRVERGGYYGHPNPLRCEWVLNGGNPTGGIDPFEVTKYPVGTQPDRNFRGVAFDFDVHKSPNGAIEYKSDVFDGALKGWLIVTRYSENDDLIALKPGGPDLDIVAARERVQGSNNSLSNPLDLVEDTRNGNLYVIEFSTEGTSKITLLKPVGSDAPRIRVSPGDVAFSDVAGDDTASGAQTVTIENIGKRPLAVASITTFGSNANQFQVVGTKPSSIEPGESAPISVVFKAGTPGPKSAILRIATDAVNSPVTEVVLRGLGAAGLGGSNEPSLQWILDTYEIAVNVGDDDSSTNVINSVPANQRAARLGDEVSAQRFVRADNATPVTVEPLAVFGPTANNPVVRFGWYPGGSTSVKNELFQVGNSPSTNAQRIAPTLLPGASLTFDPGTEAFGFYSTWPFFENRTLYSQDALNTFGGSIPHHVRVYPLKDSTGDVVENAFVIATEEHTTGYDFQDVVVIARNLKPAGAEPPPLNNPPTADAGADLTINVGTTVALAGSATDLNSDPLTYSWAQTSGPSVTLTGADTLTPSFVAPDTPTTLAFELTVSDGKDTASDSVVVKVIESPIDGLVATSDGPTVLGQPTSFNASVTNSNGVTFSWTFGDGQSASGASVTHTYLQAGDYTATVVARKSNNSLNASVAVSVTNAAPLAIGTAPAEVPINTGVVLDASTSADPDGHTPLSYSWVQVAGSAVNLLKANTAQASFIAPSVADTLEFQLTVSDAYGLSTIDVVGVVVKGSNDSNNAPVARAGADIRARVGGPALLDGGGSFDPDGHAITYAWSQVGGPNVLLGVANQPALSFTAPTSPAELTFELTVTDSFGKSARDQVRVVVAPADVANAAPLAKAGPDLRVPPSTDVTLDASESSDPNGDMMSYAWRQVSGPTVSLTPSGGRAGFFTPNGRATLVFEVKVTDAFGKFATDQVTVVVERADGTNNTPRPDAGPDLRAPLSSLVTLNASASSDPDGDALTFMWRQVSGPAVTISRADSAVASLVAPSAAATLVFEVTVTDAFGASDADRVTIIVGPVNNQPPLAKATAPASVSPGASVQLGAGASSDPDGDALTFAWRQLSGPAASLVGAQTPAPSFVAPWGGGEMVFEVTVTDVFGAKSSAQVRVRIAPAQLGNRLYLPLVRR